MHLLIQYVLVQGATQIVRAYYPVTDATGFACKIEDDTRLGNAILMADFDGGSEPVGVAVSVNEAREIAAGDMRGRMRDVEHGDEPDCPESYTLWAQGIDGRYREVISLDALGA